MSDLYRRCPDCDGVGSISVMSGDPDLHETEYECERCCFTKGYVKVEPTERVCDEHDARTDINNKPYCTQGFLLDETLMCVMSNVVRVNDV